jgi:RNA polymerase sigma factor (sigma-70 family)
MQQPDTVKELISHLFRQQAGKMTAALIHLFGFKNIAIAEDIVQDTFLAACQGWQKIPGNPEGWLMLVAKNKAINIIKKDKKLVNVPGSSFYKNEDDALTTHIEQVFAEKEISDSQLRLLFLCCHPDISPKSQIIITLRIHSGFSIDEISNAMMMNVEAVKKSLNRTRAEIREKKLYNSSGYVLLSERRMEVVHKVLYLMFNEGYKTTDSPELINKDVCYEAMRLCKLLLDVGTAKETTSALLAMMFFNAARFPARVDEAGSIISLEEQDRTQWNHSLIAEGFHYLNTSRTKPVLSKYHIEAAISSIHCTANSHADTNWEQIIYYYNLLLQWDNNPFIHLNKAIAISYAEGPLQGLLALEQVEDIDEHYLYNATKADMLYRLKQYEPAIDAYLAAYANTRSGTEKQHIQSRIDKCTNNLKTQNT